MKKLVLILMAMTLTVSTSFNLIEIEEEPILFYKDENVSIYHHKNVHVVDRDSLYQQRFLKNYIKWEMNLR